MTDETEVYSKAVVDKYLSGLYGITANIFRIVLEDRIADGRATREDTTAMLRELAAVVSNPTAQGFYAAMASNVEGGIKPGEGSPPFTVIDGGKTD